MNDERQYHSSKQSDCDDAPGENSFSHGKSPSFQLLVGGVRLLLVGLRLGTAAQTSTALSEQTGSYAPPPKPEFSFRRPIIALLCRLKKTDKRPRVFLAEGPRPDC